MTHHTLDCGTVMKRLDHLWDLVVQEYKDAILKHELTRADRLLDQIEMLAEVLDECLYCRCERGENRGSTKEYRIAGLGDN